MPEKRYEGYIVIDWRHGSMKLRVSKPELQPYEVAVKFRLTVKVPTIEIPVLDLGTLEIPEAKIEATEFEPVEVEPTGETEN